MVCSNCNKEFELEKGYIQYGFDKGRAFSISLCPECKESFSEQDIKDFIEKTIGGKK